MVFKVITEHQKELINSMLETATEEQRQALVCYGGQMYRDGLKWGAVGLGVGLVIGAAATGVWTLARLIRAGL